MRLYIFLNKELIKCIAARITDISFDIDFFEYSEKRGYTANNNTCIRPEIEINKKTDCDKIECFNRSRVDVSGEKGMLCNVQVEKRYINIEDVSSIKNNNFYYNILEKMPMDNRIKRISGKISELNETNFIIESNKFLINENLYRDLIELYDNSCDISVIGYKINCLNAENDVFKIICIYIE